MTTILRFFKEYKLLVISLLILGTFFRSYMPQLYIFGFDQVQILTNAEEIIKGNLTLIGPRTGPADMFTGPLVYYITAFFLLFLKSSFAIVGMSAFIALVTGTFLYQLVKKYISEKDGLFVLALWTFSPFLIHFDRIAWNPNLSLLASALVFFPTLGILNQKKTSKLDLFYLALGSFLGFQAHFSGLLLPFMLFVSLIAFRKFSFSALLASGVGLLGSILPTLLFDARNGWLNTRGLINFVSEKESVGGTLFWGRLLHSSKAGLEILGSLIPFQVEREVSIYLGLLIIVLVLWQFSKKHIVNFKLKNVNKNTTLSLLWVTAILLIFSLYRSNSPEYYFFIFIPPLFIFTTDLVKPILEKKLIKKDLLIISFIVLSFYTISNFEAIAGQGSLQINNQLNIAKDIAKRTQKYPVSKIAYDILEVDTLGMRYFINKTVSLSQTGSIIHIAETQNKNEKYGSYGLWVDPRNDPNYNYMISDNIVLKTNINIILLEDKYQGNKFGPFKSFKVVKDNQLSEDFLVVVRKIDNPFITGNKVHKELKDNAGTVVTGTDWKVIQHDNYKGYLKEYETYSLVYVTQKDLNEFIANQPLEAINISPGVLK